MIKADANRTRGVPAPEWSSPEAPSRAVREYLAGLDAANPADDDDTPPSEPPANSPPKNISTTDPAARWTAAPGGPAFYAYSTNYLIDLEAGIILDVEATSAHRTEEVNATRTMMRRVEERFDLKPQRLVADTAYGTGPLLDWIVTEKQIEPHIPVWDKSERSDGTLSRSEFRFDQATDAYVCANGKRLTSTGRPTAAGTVLYRASKVACDNCLLKARCCPNTPSRKIPRSIYEQARDAARTVCGTPAYGRSPHQRKKVEVLFAHLKRIMRLDRLRLRGISGARDEFLMAAAVQNVRRVARWLSPATV